MVITPPYDTDEVKTHFEVEQIIFSYFNSIAKDSYPTSEFTLVFSLFNFNTFKALWGRFKRLKDEVPLVRLGYRADSKVVKLFIDIPTEKKEGLISAIKNSYQGVKILEEKIADKNLFKKSYFCLS